MVELTDEGTYQLDMRPRIIIIDGNISPGHGRDHKWTRQQCIEWIMAGLYLQNF